jgi:nitrate reductase NapE component
MVCTSSRRVKSAPLRRRHATGALIMLYIQISQVMLRRPKRSGRTFWFIVLYASALFPLTTVAFAGKFKFTEDMFLALPDFLGGPIEYTLAHAADRSNVMSQIWYVRRRLVYTELFLRHNTAPHWFHGSATF